MSILSWLGWSDEGGDAAGVLYYLVLLLVMVITYAMVMNTDASMRDVGRLALFTALMLVHAALHFPSARVSQTHRWVAMYVLAQGGFVLFIGYVTQIQGLILGLYLALVGETAGMLWSSRRAIAAAVAMRRGLLSVATGVKALKPTGRMIVLVGSGR